MEVIVKPGKDRHPDHPSRDPQRKELERRGTERLKKIKFENDAQKRDYDRAVASNKHNVNGLPPFYPPERIAPSHGIGDGKPAPLLPCGHKWERCTLTKHGEKLYQCHFGGTWNQDVWDNPSSPMLESCRRPINEVKI